MTQDLTLTTRLARVHAEAGDPRDRLAAALCALEGAQWAALYAAPHDLYAALGAQLGAGLLRADERLGLDRAALQARGLTLAGLDADWRGAVAVWLLEPDDRALSRAHKAGVPVIVDATLSPGGGWPARGASFVAYQGGGALSGFADLPFAALLGAAAAHATAPGLPELSAALLLRDLASLPARMARQTRAAETLAERLGASLLAGCTLLLGEEQAGQLGSDWPNGPLGGVRTAVQPVPSGALLGVGLEDIEDLWRALSGAAAEAAPSEAQFTEAPPTEEQSPAPAMPNIPFPATAAAPEPAEPEPEALPAQLLPPDLPAEPGADPAGDLDEAQSAAYARLREWRNAEAKRQEVSRFIIASNATLAEIARRAPQDQDGLKAVKGMGPERLRKYAQKLLEVLHGYSGVPGQ